MTSDEPLSFAPERQTLTGHTDPPGGPRNWRLLVADDDDDVHVATELALRHVQILGRPIVLDHARSGAEVLSRMAAVGDEYYATILLDVVMETSDAGLATVSALREHLGIVATRIVLRTGQPGHAPDVEAVSNYEIDDYRTKGELTRNRLITTLTASIRAFRQVVSLNDHRRGLQKVIGAAGGLLEVRGMRAFAEGALEQVAALMDLPPDGIVCTEMTRTDGATQDELLVTGASGRFAASMGHTLAKLPDDVRSRVERCIRERAHIFDEAHTVLYLGHGKKPRAVYIATGQPLNPQNTQLVSVLATNLSAGLQNAALFSELDFAANYCLLTSLPNRYRFGRLLADALGRDQRWSVAVVDLHDFSSISKGLGYDVASELLKEVAAALSRGFRPKGCIVARLESDVFAIAGDAAVVTPAAITACFEAPFKVDVHSIHVEAAIGMDTFDASASVPLPPTDMLTRAEIALDEAKAQSQHPWKTYSNAMGERLRGDIDLINEMRVAFRNESFEVWYQPQVGAKNERAIGAEALLRWRSKSGSFVSPMRFIPLAERTGLIRDLGKSALHMALRAFLPIPGAPRISVNVSPAEMRDGDYAASVLQALERTGFPATRLTLEITESSFVSRDDRTITQFKMLRDAGVRLAVDDFGTGHASFDYLRWLDVDEVKIDKGFVGEIGNRRGHAICGTILELANRLGMETVAEGVEDAEQREKLLALGCPIIQGYYYAKPMPLADFLVWWAKQSAP